jgi:transcriptional regulator with GAF, ATPase, and Fis domain
MRAILPRVKLPDMEVPSTSIDVAFSAVSSAFRSLGRVCMALDRDFKVRHVSGALDDLLGPGAAAASLGAPIESLLQSDLLGEPGSLRQALDAGERREGWRAWLRLQPGGVRLCSLTIAPFFHEAGGACDPEAAYLVVLRGAEEDDAGRCEAVNGFSGLIARSPAMSGVVRALQVLERSEVALLLTGETGTGKGLLAQAIHARSMRKAGPFVTVNCTALPENLLESELFGHVRGAFTGAVRDRQGRFELADGGTLLLDEVGDLPIHLQAKLLRVLQERTFERVGDSRTLQTGARVIAATHRDLRRAVQEGRFREDLFYRLRVFPIEIPPLRERPEDIEPLAAFLLARADARSGRALRFSPEAMRALQAFPWPGNVRELENALEYAVTMARGQTVQLGDLPREVAEAQGSSPAKETGDTSTRGAKEAPSRREQLLSVLDACRWRIAEASTALSVSRSTLWRWMREERLTR